ncbi:hypothetical protein AAVH_18353 [Aphelenchoides avenae]|nr:hypothetical protein AAVH_18353 [Aphelenchus avenae]
MFFVLAAAIHAAAGAAIVVPPPSLNGSSIAPLLDLYQLDLADRQEPMEIPPAPAAVVILPEAPKEANQNVANQPNAIPATPPTHQAAALPTPAAPQQDVVVIGPPQAASTPLPTGNVNRPVANDLAPQLPSGSRSLVYLNSNRRPNPGPYKGPKFSKGPKPGPYQKGLKHKPQQVQVQVQRAPQQSLRIVLGPRFVPQVLHPGAYIQLLPWLQEMYKKSPKKIVGYLISMPGKNRFQRDFASKTLLHDISLRTFTAPQLGPVDVPSYWDSTRSLKDHLAHDYDCYVSQSCPLINCGGTLFNIESLHILRIQWPNGAVSPQVPQNAPPNTGE